MGLECERLQPLSCAEEGCESATEAGCAPDPAVALSWRSTAVLAASCSLVPFISLVRVRGEGAPGCGGRPRRVDTSLEKLESPIGAAEPSAAMGRISQDLLVLTRHRVEVLCSDTPGVRTYSRANDKCVARRR